MDALASGLTTMANGLFELFGHLLSPVALALVVVCAGFAWLTAVELEELDREGTKPTIAIH